MGTLTPDPLTACSLCSPRAQMPPKLGYSKYGGYKRRIKKPYTPSQLARVVPAELKFLDIEHLSDAFASTWDNMDPATFLSLSAVKQGDGENERDGRVYYIHSVHIQGRFLRAAAESDVAPKPDSIFRIVMVLDTKTNGAQLTATDVMNGGLTDDYHGFKNLQHASRFKILFDRKVVLPVQVVNEGAANLFANPAATKLFKFNRNFRPPLKVICSATPAAIASITDNSIHMIGISDTALGFLDYQSRIRFTG